MKNSLIELTPVKYERTAIKVLSFCVLKKQKCFPLHFHNRIELLRVKRGRMTVEYGKNTAVLSEGELMIITPKMLHYGYTEDSRVEYDVLMFDVRSFYNDTEVCKNLLPAIYDGRAVFKNITKDEETIACFDKICKNHKQDSLEITSEIYRFIYLIYQKNLVELQERAKNDSIKKLTDYLEENFAQQITNEVLCKQFGYTPEHLCRKFKERTGLTPLTYLKIYRLDLARKMLQDTDVSVSEIAAACGFDDANYFARCFKAHFECSPSKYRKK